MKYILYSITLLLIQFSYAQVVTTDRIAYYSFDGNADDTESGYDGVVFGPTLVEDRFGNVNGAYFFDGINDFIEIAHNEEMNFSGGSDFSISLWLNISSVQNDLRGSVNDVIGKWDAINATGYPYAIRYRNQLNNDGFDNRMNLLRYNSEVCNGDSRFFGECITKDVWHHIVFQKQGSTLYYYEDGVLISTLFDDVETGCSTQNNLPIQIGKRSGRDLRYFTGMIDDISFYSRALTETEIETILDFNSWTVTEVLPSEITSFDLLGIDESQLIINSDDQIIDMEVPCGTDLSLVPIAFALSDNAIVEFNGVEQTSGISSLNFQNPVILDVINDAKCIEDEWTVNVSLQSLSDPSSSVQLSSFGFAGVQTLSVDINYESLQINVILPCDEDLNDLNPIVEIPNDAEFIIEELADYSNPVEMIISNSNTCYEETWTIVVSLESASDPAESVRLSSFGFEGIEAQGVAIDYETFTVTALLECGVNTGDLNVIVEIPNDAETIIDLQADYSNPVTMIIANNTTCYEESWTVITEIQKFSISDIQVSDPFYFIPNVITPNGDLKNEQWILGDYFLGSDVTIVNRNGTVVFKSGNYQNQFDGFDLASGVYYYVINNDCTDAPVKGHLSILY